MNTDLTLDNVGDLLSSHLELRRAAEDALRAGESAELWVIDAVRHVRDDINHFKVVTLVVGDRAGQDGRESGSPAWGTWREDDRLVVLDDPSPDGETLALCLDGTEQPWPPHRRFNSR